MAEALAKSGSDDADDWVEIELPNGYTARISAVDHEWVSKYRWHVGRGPTRAYPRRNGIDHDGVRRLMLLHRLVVGALPGQIVDHINGDTLDCRRENLRITDRTGNARNMINSKNKKRGGYKGVVFIKRDRLWRAEIGAGELKADGRRRKIGLGCYRDAETAARVYDLAAIKHFGEFASTNFDKTDLVGFVPPPTAGEERGATRAIIEGAVTDEWARAVEIGRPLGVSDGLSRFFLRSLYLKGLIERTGIGTSGSPFLYRRLAISHAPPDIPDP